MTASPTERALPESGAPRQVVNGVSICIAAFNEEENLPHTVEEAAATLKTLPGHHEILVVDDGSQDGTWEVLRRLQASFPQLRILRHERNQGIAAAQQTLVSAAEGEYIFHIGADRQWRMNELPRMLRELEEGDYDIVIGVRTDKRYTRWRKLVSFSYNAIVALLWGKHFGDLGSIKLARASLWKKIPFGSSSAFVHAQRLLIAHNNGARIGATPVEHLERVAGRSNFTSPYQAWRALRELVSFRFSKLNGFRLGADWREQGRSSAATGTGTETQQTEELTTMQVPFFDLQEQTNELMEQVMQRVEQVCRSCCFTLGPDVERFEANFAAYCQADHCVAVNSGTSALHLALAAHGVGPGDEVITTPMTFVATAWAISYVGAKPILVDVDPRTWNLDPTRLFDALTPRTKAILPVHLYGRPAEMDAILEIAQEQGIPVIEDAAQAHGARYRGKRVGGIGAAGCFSFYPSKNLGAWGEGGALVTNDQELARKARALRDHGQFQQKGRHDAIGFNYRMISLQAAILDVKLTRLDDWTAQRRRLANLYLQRLSGTLGLEFPTEASDVDPVYHLFVVALADRQKVADQLRARGVATGIHYPIPVHLQPAYQHLGMRKGSLPVAERLAQQCLSLPMFPELKSDQVNYVCDQLIASLEEQPRPAPAEVTRHAPLLS